MHKWVYQIFNFQNNQIEEIANTLVNVIQHNSKPSGKIIVSGNQSIKVKSVGTRLSAAQGCNFFLSSQKSSNESKCHSLSSGSGTSKRIKWPWGFEPIKPAVEIPLELTDLTDVHDPRIFSSLQKTQQKLPLPRFASDTVGRNLIDSSIRRRPESCRPKTLVPSVNHILLQFTNGIFFFYNLDETVNHPKNKYIEINSLQFVFHFSCFR